MRRDLWRDLAAIRASDGTTVVLTTHLLDEAAAGDHVFILDRGRLVVDGAPDALTRMVGGDVIRLHGAARPTWRRDSRPGFRRTAAVVDDEVRVEHDHAHTFVAALVDAFPGEIRSVHFGRPTLEDVFVRFTGGGSNDAGRASRSGSASWCGSSGSRAASSVPSGRR